MREVSRIDLPSARALHLGITFVKDCQQRWCEVRYETQQGWVDTSLLGVETCERNVNVLDR